MIFLYIQMKEKYCIDVSDEEIETASFLDHQTDSDISINDQHNVSV
jgi:hypothetical protein